MTYSEIQKICIKGKLGIVPGWIGYLKWDYSKNKLRFVNEDYVMPQKELEDKIKDRTDLYYII